MDGAYEERPSFEEYAAELERLAAGSGAVELEVAGSSVEGRPVYRVRIRGCGERVLVTAGHHGDEPAGPLAALELVREAAERGSPTTLDLTLYPLVNPDGYEADRRQNAGGADLNRDYGTFAQPEARAVRGAVDGADFLAALDLHEAPGYSGGFFVFESEPSREDISLGQAAVDAVAERYPIGDGVVRVERPGSLRQYLADRGAYAVTFEPPGASPLGERVAMEGIALRRCLEELEGASSRPAVPEGAWAADAPAAERGRALMWDGAA